MKLGIAVYSSDADTAWNAFRFGSFALKQSDAVRVFLLGKGVESESLGSADAGHKIFTVPRKMSV